MVKCVPKCVKCCFNTEMILSERDINRICSLGFSRKQFSEFRGGFWRLKNLEGRCVFLDLAKRGCTIYDFRPEGCRIYPVIYCLDRGFTVNRECPAWRTVSEEEFRVKSMRLKKLLMELGVEVEGD